MADLTQTAANVRATATTQTNRVTAGETIAPGQPVYRKASDGKYYKAAAGAAATAAAEGIALNNADADDVLFIAIGGDIDPGGTLTLGEVYLVSGTSGGIMPSTDLGSGKYATVLGVPTTTANLKLAITASGAARP